MPVRLSLTQGPLSSPASRRRENGATKEQERPTAGKLPGHRGLRRGGQEGLCLHGLRGASVFMHQNLRSQTSLADEPARRWQQPAGRTGRLPQKRGELGGEM